MAQYKRFAEPGSFQINQISVPDQSKQIEKEAARQLKGMQAAYDFKKTNDKIIQDTVLRGQQQKEDFRKSDFEREQQNKKLIFEAEAENLKREVDLETFKAQQSIKGIKDIVAFAPSAVKLVGEVQETIKKNKVAALNQIALEGGLNLNDLKELRGIEKKLTQSQFNQLEFIQQKRAEGASAEYLNLLFRAYENSASNLWFESTAAYQNTVLSHRESQELKLQEALKAAEAEGRQLSPQEVQALTKSFDAEYIAQNFAGARREVLESSGVFQTMRKNTNALNRSFFEQDAKLQVQREKDAVVKNLTNVYKKDGGRNLAGIVSYITSMRSASSREQAFEWAKNAVLSGAMEPYEGENLLDKRFGQEQSLGERFFGRKEVVELRDAIRKRQGQIRADYDNSKKAERINAERRQLEYIQSQPEYQQGLVFPQEKIDYLGDIMREAGFPDVETDLHKAMKTHVDTAVNSEQILNQWDKQYKETGRLPSEEVINNSFIPIGAKNKWLGMAKKSNEHKDLIKEANKLIATTFRSQPELATLKKAGIESPTVGMKIAEAQRDFEKSLANRLDLSSQSTQSKQQQQEIIIAERDAAITRAMAYISNANNINTKGEFVDVLEDLRAGTGVAEVEESNRNNQEVLNFVKKQDFSRGALKIHTTQSLGASGIYSARDSLKEGKTVSPRIKYNARAFGMTPLAYVNLLSKANGLDPVEFKSPWAAAVESLPRQDYTYLNAYKNSASGAYIQKRVQHRMTGNSMSVRDSFNNTNFIGDKPLKSFASQVSSIVFENESGEPGLDVYFEDKKFPAVLGGVVKEVGWQGNSAGGYGNYIVVESFDPTTNNLVDVLYAHLAEPSPYSEGTTILPGAVIGTQGGTGSVRSVDGTIASIDFLAPAPKGSGSMVPYKNFRQLREYVASQLRR